MLVGAGLETTGPAIRDGLKAVPYMALRSVQPANPITICSDTPAGNGRG